MLKSLHSIMTTETGSSRLRALYPLGVALLAALAPAAHAAPTVTGNVISWPADGWYQVQSSDGLVNLCNGTAACTVEPGTYIVLNHTKQQRFTGVKVGIGDANTSDDVRVSGNVISWPDDGWYQVQSSDGLASLCNGTAACTVEPGSYIVINHTTGQRFEGIVVTGDNGGNGTPMVSDEALKTTSALVEALAGYQLDQASHEVFKLVEQIVAEGINATPEQSNGITIIDRGNPVPMPYERTRYTCSGGGTLSVDGGLLDIAEADYSRVVDNKSYTFVDCIISLTDAELPDGSYRLNGQANRATDTLGGTRTTVASELTSFVQFSIDATENNSSVRIVGSVTASMDSSDGQSRDSRSVKVSEYLSDLEGGPRTSLTDVDFLLERTSSAAGLIHSYQLKADGAYLGTLSGGMDVSIITNPSLQRVLALGAESDSNVPFTGQMQLSFADGRELALTANAAHVGDVYTPLVDITYLTAKGDVMESAAQPLPDIAIFAPQ